MPEQPSNEVLAERIKALDDHLTKTEKTLGERINTSDKNLREHIRHQVGQVADALAAAQRENKITYNAQEKATGVALQAATALADTHNDLLRQMEKKDATYATSQQVGQAVAQLKDALEAFKDEREHRFEALKANYEPRFQRLETFQVRLGTVAVLLGIIGVSNLVKLWFG